MDEKKARIVEKGILIEETPEGRRYWELKDMEFPEDYATELEERIQKKMEEALEEA